MNLRHVYVLLLHHCCITSCITASLLLHHCCITSCITAASQPTQPCVTACSAPQHQHPLTTPAPSYCTHTTLITHLIYYTSFQLLLTLSFLFFFFLFFLYGTLLLRNQVLDNFFLIFSFIHF